MWSWLTTGTMSASPQIIDASTKRAALSHRRAPLGPRVVGLFVLSALLPLILCAALLYAQFSSQLERSTTQSLDGLLRSFGMTIMARLGNAADDLKVIVTAPGATDAGIRTDAAKLPWGAHVILTSPKGLELYSSAG